MTENVFDNAAKSLQHAKDEITSQLNVENARHETVIDQEDRYHARRVFELERLISEFEGRLPQEKLVVSDLPHSKYCSHVLHDHGSSCHNLCPTCHGMPKSLGKW